MLGAVPEQVVDGGDGIHGEVGVVGGESFQEVLDDLLYVEGELLAVERDVADRKDCIFEDLPVTVVLADALMDAAYDLVLLELLKCLTVVL